MDIMFEQFVTVYCVCGFFSCLLWFGHCHSTEKKIWKCNRIQIMAGVIPPHRFYLGQSDTAALFLGARGRIWRFRLSILKCCKQLNWCLFGLDRAPSHAHNSNNRVRECFLFAQTKHACTQCKVALFFLFCWFVVSFGAAFSVVIVIAAIAIVIVAETVVIIVAADRNCGFYSYNKWWYTFVAVTITSSVECTIWCGFRSLSVSSIRPSHFVCAIHLVRFVFLVIHAKCN